MSSFWYKKMSKRKNLLLIGILSSFISVSFVLISMLFVCLTDYDPLKNHFLLNLFVWFVEFSISYFIIIGGFKIFNKKVILFNKWIFYISSLLTVIIISFLPGGFESVFVTTYFGIISFIELFQIAYKQQNEMIVYKVKKDK